MILFIGGNSAFIQGERCNLGGFRCASASFSARRHGWGNAPVDSLILMDSGAFQDVKAESRIDFKTALQRQLSVESDIKREWLIDCLYCFRFNHNLASLFLLTLILAWHCFAFASYDQLIDEKWVDGKKQKQRWTEQEAWNAVGNTIAAAKFFDENRSLIAPRILILGCQGVTASQYRKCVESVLVYAKPEDWIGLGGWCILGLSKFRHWLPEFYKTLLEVIPLIADSPVTHVHLYGVTWLEPLGRFQRICDQYGLTCSTDSKKPLSDCRWVNLEHRKKAGVRHHYWRDNVNWWIDSIESLPRDFNVYQMPYQSVYDHQLSLFEDVFCA